MPRLRPPAAVALVLFAVVSAVHLVAQALSGSAADSWANVTQWLLLPLLAAALLLQTSTPRSRTVRLTLLAFGFSWLGDWVPDLFDGDASFLAMVGCFLLAQVTFIVAFWPFRARSALVVGRARLLAYLAVVGVLVAVCAPGAGVLLVPVLVYGLCLGTMAVLATGLGPLVAIGGALFLVSDGLIAVRAFSDLQIPQNGLLVMASYLAAQVLIGAGVLAREPVSSPESAAPAGAHGGR